MKKSKNVYDGLEFEDRPYDENGQFSVYIPKTNDSIMQLIQKERLKSQKQRDFARTSGGMRQSNPNEASNTQLKQKLMFDIQAGREMESDGGFLNIGGASMPVTTQHKNINDLPENNSNFYPQTTKHQGSSSEHMKDSNLYKSVNFNENHIASPHQSTTNLRNSVNDMEASSSLRPNTTTLQNQRYRPHFKELPAATQTAQSMTQSQTQSVGFSKILEKEKMIRKLTKQLYFDQRTQTVPKTTVQNKIIENIIQDGDIFLEQKVLLDSIYKLKQLNLLQENQTSIQKLRANNKFGFVYNDFHTKATNNGFSRQPVGGYFFTR